MCRGSQEQVHLDVENELLEAMSDTVSNRARPQGEYITVRGTDEEVLYLNYVQEREKYPVTNMGVQATFFVFAFLWKCIKLSRKCQNYFPFRCLLFFHCEKWKDCLNLRNMAPM